jgi:transposase
MLSLTGFKFWMCTIDTDMRKGRNGLSGMVTNHMKCDALDPETIYIFFNNRRNQVKLLLWEGDGHGVYHKQLTSGTYEPPEFTGSNAVEISRKQLSLILDGIEIKYRKRYNR